MKAAFIFVAPQSDKDVHRTVVKTPAVELSVVGVKNYAEAESVAKELVSQGIEAIELCAGFGNEGVGRVSRAVAFKVPVGVVRFDTHPGLGFKSGDSLF